MARAPRLLMYLLAAAATLGLALTGARADPDAGSPYIYVSKQVPQRLYLIDGGDIVFESPVNTGIQASPTPDGVFHVFASYSQKTMKGTDPVTLRPYNDANVPYAMYYDGGRAIHGFHRRGYGYPQSFGCVELPVSKARELYQLLQGGLETEVIVASHPPVLPRDRVVSSEARISHVPNPPYRSDLRVAAGTLTPPQ